MEAWHIIFAAEAWIVLLDNGGGRGGPDGFSSLNCRRSPMKERLKVPTDDRQS